MVLTVPGTRTVVVLRRVRQRNQSDSTKWARDDRGNAVYVDERVEVPGCSVQPSTSSEQDSEERVQLATSITIYAPLSWPAGPIDAVEIDGIRWEVQGRPQRWDHPRLGHVVVVVQEASGG